LYNYVRFQTKEGYWVKIINDPYTPLTIQLDVPIFPCDPYSEHNLGDNRKDLCTMSLCHYGAFNGDLMADPEIVFVRKEPESGKGPGGYYPLYFRNDYLHVEQFVYEPGEIYVKVNFKLQKELADFCNEWVKNIKEQGFLEKTT
jgi:hypothetical protein